MGGANAAPVFACKCPLTYLNLTKLFEGASIVSTSKPRPPAAMVKAAKLFKERIVARNSPVHGKGVFALVDVPANEALVEYVGEIINWEEALERHPHDPEQPNHTFYFHIDEHNVIDANVGGNRSRWINHSCAPNCEADERAGRVFIKSLRPLVAGEELFYDYGLNIDEPHTPELLADYPCWCGAPNCRGTLLSPKDDGDDALAGKPKKPAKPAKPKAKAKTKTNPKTKVKRAST